MSVTTEVRSALAAYVSHTDPTQGWDSNDGYDELEYDDNLIDEEELNDRLVIACIHYERCLGQSGMNRSLLLLDAMTNHLRQGDNQVFLNMLRRLPGFAQFIAKKHSDLIPLITANVGPIVSHI